jgi:hypothetical protein
MWAFFFMLFSSGQKIRPRLSQRVYSFMCDKEPLIKDAAIVVHHRRLTSEGATGFEYKDGKEFMIEIERELPRNEYIKTLIHELVHVRQDLTNNTDHTKREEEAWALEEFYSWIFND